jgi:hypothetical protein
MPIRTKTRLDLQKNDLQKTKKSKIPNPPSIPYLCFFDDIIVPLRSPP